MAVVGGSSLCVGVFVLFGILAGLLIYFIPTGIAVARGHHNTAAIAAVNLLLGWVFIGWVVALVWSLTSPPQNDRRR